MMTTTLPQFRGKVYPDKSFSLGYVPRKKARKAERDYEHAYKTQDDINPLDKLDWLLGSSTIEGAFVSLSEAPSREQLTFSRSPEHQHIKEALEGLTLKGLYLFARYYNGKTDPSSPLFIKSLKSSQKKRGSYGKHGITRFGRRFVKNACILLEQKYGRRRLGFATCTLPGMDRHTCFTINGSISDITRRFYQKIRRKFEKRNRQFIYVGVVEIQEERFRNTSLPVPHLHFVYLAKDGIHSRYTCNTPDFYRAWNESVNEVLVKLGKTPIMGYGRHKGSVKLEPIHASAAAYLGKYISKGSTVVKEMQEKGFKEFPKQWWTASMQMKKMVKDCTHAIDGKLAYDIFYNYVKYLDSGLIESLFPVYVPINGVEKLIGFSGRFSSDMYERIRYLKSTKRRRQLDGNN